MKIEEIQVLRAIAILLVLAQHLSLTATAWNAFPSHGSMPFFIGVELFFVISGLVVTRSIFSRKLDALEFVFRRIFRLLPAILFFLFFSAIVTGLARLAPADTWGYQNLATPWSQFIYQAVAIIAGVFINIGSAAYMNGAMWSLSVEFQFYAGYAIWIAILVWTKCGLVFARRTTFALACFFYAVLLMRRFETFRGAHFFEFELISYFEQFRFDFLFLGVIISFLKLPRFGWGPTAAMAAFAISLALTAACEAPLIAGPKPFLEGVAMPVIGACFAFICLLANSGIAFHGHNSKAFAVMSWIGDRSYSIYLLHFPIMGLSWLVFYRYTPVVFVNPYVYGLVQASFTLALTFALAHFSYEFIEKPGQRLGRQLVGRNAEKALGSVG